MITATIIFCKNKSFMDFLNVKTETNAWYSALFAETVDLIHI